jgi:hypothetical protein
MGGTASALAALLSEYADPDPEQAPRLVNVPPETAARGLALLPPDLTSARLNLTQPPMAWLVQQAAELGGRLTGALPPGKAFLLIDGIQVPAASSRELAGRISSAFPATADAPAALPGAVCEAWSSWDADAPPVWTGTGEDLLSGALPADARVVGYWWD